MWVGGAVLSGPENCFASFVLCDNFGLRDMERGDLVACSVLDIVLEVDYLNMNLGIETAKVFDCEFAQSCGCEKGSG